ncbi:hypothetical protein tb265_25470 [Gemmatimonadetes bacterium T265]|nr:hypothetical protein tb265_25470 [Gemmatimonadetes bacterium T265]
MTHPNPDHLPPADDLPDDELRALIARVEALPPLRPSRDLWPGIAARLDVRPDAAPTERRVVDPSPPVAGEPTGARVLAFHAPPTVRAPRVVRRHGLAAAAVALATLSSGATYLAMRRAPAPTIAASTGAPARAAVVAGPRAPGPDVPAPAVADPRRANPRPTEPAPASSLADGTDAEPRSRGVVRTASRSVDATVPGAADYDREIAELRAVVAQRPGELDSATVDVLARNLRIIDAAIAASRAALARDPHSPFLGEQLTRALGQKVDLLRTAALLPHT